MRAPSALRAALAALVLALAGPPLAGCVTIGRSTTGAVPAAYAVEALPKGAPVGQVLALLGAPSEYSIAPDGILLVWRELSYDYERVGIDPSWALGFLSIGQLAADALSNLRLTLEWGEAREERVAVLLDLEGNVLAVAHRDGEGRRLR